MSIFIPLTKQKDWGFDEPIPESKYFNLANTILEYCK